MSALARSPGGAADPGAVGPRPTTPRFLHLTWTLAVHEFKLRFFGSVLGYLWQLIRPLLLFGVLYVFFTQVVKVSARRALPRVAAAPSCSSTSSPKRRRLGAAVVDRENLVRKIRFPRLVIPLAVVLTALFNLGAEPRRRAGLRPRRRRAALKWLELPVLVVLLAAFATGIAMLLSALYVRFRDIRPIWEVVLQVLFYATLIIFPSRPSDEKLPIARTS